MLDDRLTTILAFGFLTVALALRHTIITLSGLLICLGEVPRAWVSKPKTLFFPYLILPLSVSVHATSLWPAVKTEDDYIKVSAPCIHV